MKKRQNKIKMRICSLFAGCGGLDLGFELAENEHIEFESVWANDIDSDCCKTYTRNFPNAEVVNQDIWSFNLKKLPNCDVILGGFPCQDFSVLRGDEVKRKGVETKRGVLYTKFVEAVYIKKPIFFVAENVKGLLSANNGKAITQILNDFKKVGYDIHYKLLNFADYGVPQRRERVVIVGIREDLDGSFNFPAPTHKNHISAKTALSGVDKIKYNNEKINTNQKTIQMLKSIPAGGNYKDIPEYSKRNWMSLIYKRLHPDEPSPTIVALGGGGTWGYHYDEPRPLTNRERARIQSFPDHFVFEGSPAKVRMQIGNAVPPRGIRPIAEAIAEHLHQKINMRTYGRQFVKRTEKPLYVQN
ncbi:DNA cytosine methyltransferase [Candidatus Woesearchaeota archaeon]|nr:DNA cytosine methyltransferase [Candidatus Woesearchaeota archaeon]